MASGFQTSVLTKLSTSTQVHLYSFAIDTHGNRSLQLHSQYIKQPFSGSVLWPSGNAYHNNGTIVFTLAQSPWCHAYTPQ